MWSALRREVNAVKPTSATSASEIQHCPSSSQIARPAASSGAWIVFQDEAGATLRPPKARTWAPRGHTPVVRGVRQGRAGVDGRAGLLPARLPGPAVLR